MALSRKKYSSRELNKMGEGQMHGRGEVGRMI